MANGGSSEGYGRACILNGLAEAVCDQVEGSWVVIEDIDKVSSDVLAILPSPNDDETGYLVLEQNRTLRVHPDFVLIGSSDIEAVLLR